MSFPFSEIQKILTGNLIQFHTNHLINHLETDSRKPVLLGKETLFFAFKSKNGHGRNGHDFVAQAFKNGIRNFIVSEQVELPIQANVFKVADTLEAFQKLAAQHRKQFTFPVLGITGSNGKTIVKEWLYQLLQPHLNLVRSPKSYNSQIGVPLSVWQMEERQAFGIFEAGISEQGEMARLQKIIQPTLGLFTNIGPAHNAGFNNLEQKIKEKLALFSEVQTLVYCQDHLAIHNALGETKIKTFSWSEQDKSANLFFIKNDLSYNLIAQTPSSNLPSVSLILPFQDEASKENLLHCIACLYFLIIEENAFSYPENQLSTIFLAAIDEAKLKALQTMPMRLSQKAGINNCLLIDDTYNSDLDSLQIALDFQKQQNNHLTNTVVLSDILETGIKEEDLYKNILAILNSRKIQKFIGIGKHLIKYKSLFEEAFPQTRFFNKTEELLQALPQMNFQSECILFKGARVFQLEKIVERLSEKLHQTTLEINLNALKHNLKVYKSLLEPKTKIMAMVKAFSYGAGTYEIANALQFSGVDYLCVAYTDEGIALRKAGIHLPIMVLSPEPNTFPALLSENLEPEIYGIAHLNQLIKFLNQHNYDRPLNIHLNFDTGMHRLGLSKEELPELLSTLEKTKQVKVASVFSHLMGSEDQTLATFTKKQFTLFREIVDIIEKQFQVKLPKHILNTAGIIHYPEMQMQMVRLGLGLYGIDSTKSIQEKLQLIGKFKSHISQIRKVSKGEGIGYNWSEKLSRDSIIGIVSVGYGDGLLRKASNGRFAFKIKNQLAPIIGRVCMDMCMIDLTDINDVFEGDEVIVFDDIKSIHRLSNALETIPYEVLTNLSDRVKRIYVQD